MRLLWVTVFLSTLSVSSFSAAQIDDTEKLTNAATILGKSSASFEVCGIDTSRSLPLLKKLLQACKATDYQKNQAVEAFTLGRIQRRAEVEGKNCPWTQDHAQKNYDDGLEYLKSVADVADNGGTPNCN